MFIKTRRAILVELLGPQGPNLEFPQTPTSPSNNHTFLENSTLKRVCPIHWWNIPLCPSYNFPSPI